MSEKNNGTSDPLDFIKPIMIYYLNSIKNYQLESSEKSSLGNQIIDSDPLEDNLGLEKHKFSLSNLKSFMKVAPNLQEIRKGLKCMLDKEVIIYKIVLDILGSYIRLFYGLDSRIYTEKYLPTVLDFYKKVN
jgi:hypothetical protein